MTRSSTRAGFAAAAVMFVLVMAGCTSDDGTAPPAAATETTGMASPRDQDGQRVLEPGTRARMLRELKTLRGQLRQEVADVLDRAEGAGARARDIRKLRARLLDHLARVERRLQKLLGERAGDR